MKNLVAKLDPDMDAFLQTIATWSKSKGFDASSLSVEKLRSVSKLLREEFQPPLGSDLKLMHGNHATRGGSLRYTAVSSVDRILGECPLGLYFFGGGFVASGIEQALNEAARIAKAIRFWRVEIRHILMLTWNFCHQILCPNTVADFDMDGCELAWAFSHD